MTPQIQIPPPGVVVAAGELTAGELSLDVAGEAWTAARFLPLTDEEKLEARQVSSTWFAEIGEGPARKRARGDSTGGAGSIPTPDAIVAAREEAFQRVHDATAAWLAEVAKNPEASLAPIIDAQASFSEQPLSTGAKAAAWDALDLGGLPRQEEAEPFGTWADKLLKLPFGARLAAFVLHTWLAAKEWTHASMPSRDACRDAITFGQLLCGVQASNPERAAAALGALLVRLHAQTLPLASILSDPPQAPASPLAGRPPVSPATPIGVSAAGPARSPESGFYPIHPAPRAIQDQIADLRDSIKASFKSEEAIKGPPSVMRKTTAHTTEVLLQFTSDKFAALSKADAVDPETLPNSIGTVQEWEALKATAPAFFVEFGLLFAALHAMQKKQRADVYKLISQSTESASRCVLAMTKETRSGRGKGVVYEPFGGIAAPAHNIGMWLAMSDEPDLKSTVEVSGTHMIQKIARVTIDVRTAKKKTVAVHTGEKYDFHQDRQPCIKFNNAFTVAVYPFFDKERLATSMLQHPGVFLYAHTKHMRSRYVHHHLPLAVSVLLGRSQVRPCLIDGAFTRFVRGLYSTEAFKTCVLDPHSPSNGELADAFLKPVATLTEVETALEHGL